MGNEKNEKGNRYGRLFVKERVLNNKRGDAMWNCLCDCGNTCVVSGKNLRNGHAQSCGCLLSEKSRERMAHMLSKHGDSGTKLHRIWRGIKERCLNKACKSYPDYGGRGTTICEEWLNSFEAFRDWALANGYRDGLTIDREDNDGNYCPENCRWVTRSENSKKTRRCRLVTITDQKSGQTYEAHSVAEASRITGVKINTIIRMMDGKTTRETQYFFK